MASALWSMLTLVDGQLSAAKIAILVDLQETLDCDRALAQDLVALAKRDRWAPAFGLHLDTATTVNGRDRRRLERVCRCLLRPVDVHGHNAGALVREGLDEVRPPRRCGREALPPARTR